MIAPTMVVAPARYVLIPLASIVTGYTVKAIEKKIEAGVWVEGRQWKIGPDGRIFIDLEGYIRWVENQYPGA